MAQRRSKYGNKKVVVNGLKFDSKKEAQRYSYLLMLKNAGIISDLELQKEFEIIPAQYETFARYGKNGKRLKDGRRCLERPVKYIADFVYRKDGELIVEDTKGMLTPDYVIKRKALLYLKGIRISEIRG